MTSLPRPRGPLLDGVYGPHDVRALEAGRLPRLAGEVRDFLAGHGTAAGPAELAIALHRVFDAHRDTVLWGGGLAAGVTRAYDLLAGRREPAGAAGGVRRTLPDAQALSYAGGLARSFRLRGCAGRRVVVVVDGEALAGGTGWEALGALAQAPGSRIVVVVLEAEDGTPAYEGARRTPGQAAGGPLSGAWHTVGRGLRDLFGAQGPWPGGAVAGVARWASGGGPPGLVTGRGAMSEPVDGTGVAEVEAALRTAREAGAPVLVRCVARWGGRDVQPWPGLHAARSDDPRPRAWTSVFAEELARVGAERPEVVAVHAASGPGPELGAFAATHPERVVATGHTTAHVTACAAGLAAGGLHPVLAVRDLSPLRALEPLAAGRGVTVALRGTGGPDGLVPGPRRAVPRDAARLRALLHTALGVDDAPTVVCVPDGPVGPDIDAVAHDAGVDVLRRGPAAHGDVLLVSVGAMARTCLDAARLLEARGVAVTVVDPGWTTPLPARLPKLAAAHGLAVTVEDDGGTGDGTGTVAARLSREHPHTPLLPLTPPADGTPLTGGAIAEAVARRLGEPDGMRA